MTALSQNIRLIAGASIGVASSFALLQLLRKRRFVTAAAVVGEVGQSPTLKLPVPYRCRFGDKHVPDAVDLRSDTETQPTPAMRLAMATAEVGDDHSGEDPTVNQLEFEAAVKTGKSAGCFVCGGAQGNMLSLVALSAAASPTKSLKDHAPFHVFLGHCSHISNLNGVFESWWQHVGNFVMHPLPQAEDGTFDLADLESEIVKVKNSQGPSTLSWGALCLEVPVSFIGNAVPPMSYISQVAEIGHRHGLKLHMDGARIFNGALVLGMPVAEVVKSFDSVTFCLSKGLGCPAGALICGDSQFVAIARKFRLVFGATMRQTGVIAAAGLVALQEHETWLRRDHENALELREAIKGIDGCVVSKYQQGNLVWVDIPHNRDPKMVQKFCNDRKVFIVAISRCPVPYEQMFPIRLAVSYHYSPEHKDIVVSALKDALSSPTTLMGHEDSSPKTKGYYSQ